MKKIYYLIIGLIYIFMMIDMNKNVCMCEPFLASRPEIMIYLVYILDLIVRSAHIHSYLKHPYIIKFTF